MNFVERIAKWVGVDIDGVSRPELVTFKASMEVARAEKRAENYPASLEAFGRAAEMAEIIGDVMALSLIRLHLTDIYTRIGDWDAAQANLDLVLRSGDGVYPTAPRAYAKVALGQLKYAQGDADGARDSFEDAMETGRKAKSPGAEGRAMGNLALVYLREGNASYAAHLLRESLPKISMAGDMEMTPPFITRLAEALIASGDTAEADGLLSRGLRLAEQTHSRGDLRRLNMLLAKRALDLGRYAESYNHYERALQFTDEDAPERPAALREVATACLYLDKNQDALVYAERAYALRPDDPAIRGTLGVILQSVGRAEEALPHLKAAILVAEPDYDTLRALAAAYDQAKRPVDALKTLEVALELARKADLPLEQARTERDIGHVHFSQRRTADAIKAWAAAFDLYEAKGNHSQAARLLCDIANARMSIGQHLRAYKDYEQALMLVGSDDLATRGVVLSNAATVYVERGDIETAEAFFAESLQIAQKTHDAAAEATRRGNFGWFLLNTGRYERAHTALGGALEMSEKLGLRLQATVQASNLAQLATARGDDEAAQKLHLRALAMADTLDAPRWQAAVRNAYAQWLTANGQADDALALAAESLALAQTSQDSEAMARASIEIARARIGKSPAQAAAELAPLVNQVRTPGNKRLLADAMTAWSQALAANGSLSEARVTWDGAHKIYTALGHPLKSLQPDWLDKAGA